MNHPDEQDQATAGLQESSEPSDGVVEVGKTGDRGPTDEELLQSLRDAIRRVEGR